MPAIAGLVFTDNRGVKFRTAALATASTNRNNAAAQTAAAKKQKEAAARKKSATVAYAKAHKKPTSKLVKEIHKKPAEPGADYKWNLPPHLWSTPIKARDMVNVAPNENIINEGDSVQLDRYRRGRFFWYATADQDFRGSSATPSTEQGANAPEAHKFGFQFIWNPDNYSTNVQLNTDVTPSPADRGSAVAAAFPSGATISFTLRLDRTNDFMCAKNLLNTATTNADYEQLAQFYTKSGNFSQEGATQMAAKIKDLLTLGTISDLEYIYKMVNGEGWHNVSGRLSSDIGFLKVTMIRIDIGPASYVGYINSLSINHTGFSQDMTPIRTDVQISINTMASAGLAVNKTLESTNPAGNH
jgi:hypothetical protein